VIKLVPSLNDYNDMKRVVKSRKKLKNAVKRRAVKRAPKAGRSLGDLGLFAPKAGELGDAALRVLKARYLLRNSAGEVIESPDQMFRRVAKAVASCESAATRASWEEKFFKIMRSLKFIPNSPTLMNAGKPQGQLAACFVLPIEDSISSVFSSLHNAAIIHKSGGGTGFNFGQIRPRGDLVQSSGGRASGPVAFLKIFDLATGVIKQGGTRRGANMAILPIDHPDIEQFIASKTAGGITNFNISVGISDAFLQCLKRNGKWNLINPQTKEVVAQLPAKSLWSAICENAWRTGDPGVVFLDTIEKQNPTPDIGKLDSTNPCGEQPLLPYESCNLGSISLAPYLSDKDLDWRTLEQDIETAVRFLDNVIDVNWYPLPEIKNITEKNRKIGLGIMGWADALLHWKIAYDSEDALRRATLVAQRFHRVAVSASERLAKERGAFENFQNSLWAKRKMAKRRNATVTTIAPTGTISIIAGVSSGIEPIFSYAHERQALDGQRFYFLHSEVFNLVETGVLDRKSIERILRTGTLSKVPKLSSTQKRVFRTAFEIAPIWHVRMQAVFQRMSESAVSKTINLPENATPADIGKIYLKAHELGCKGITVYRDQSKTAQVLTRGIRKKF